MVKNIYFPIVISLFFSLNNFVFSQNKFIKENNRRKIIELKKELDLTDDQEIQIANILSNTKYSKDEAKRIGRLAKMKMKENKKEMKKEKKAEKKRIKEEKRMAKEQDEDDEEDSKTKIKPRITKNKGIKKAKIKKEILVYREDQRAKIERILLPDQRITFLHLVQGKVDSIKLNQTQRNQR